MTGTPGASEDGQKPGNEGVALTDLLGNRLDAFGSYYRHFLAAFVVYLAINSALVTALVSMAMSSTVSGGLQVCFYIVFSCVGIGLAALHIVCVLPQRQIREHLVQQVKSLETHLGLSGFANLAEPGELLLKHTTRGVLWFEGIALGIWLTILVLTLLGVITTPAPVPGAVAPPLITGQSP